jgi:hypothetical protein
MMLVDATSVQAAVTGLLDTTWLRETRNAHVSDYSGPRAGLFLRPGLSPVHIEVWRLESAPYTERRRSID